MDYQVDIELCIGLHGVCVISITGDELDAVDDDITQRGTEAWFARLPEHTKPVEGIYALRCEVSDSADGLSYQIKQ